MVDYKAIGRRIKKYRKDSNMTQAVLSEKMNVAENYVSQIECGHAQVSLPRLYEIAEILHIDIAFLVSDGRKSDDLYASDLDELIENWTPEKIDFLYKMVKSLDEIMKSS